MNSIQHVITAFYSGSAVIGIPSLAGIVFCSAYLIAYRRIQDTGYMSVPNPDAVLLVLTGIARVMQFLAKSVGALGKWVARAVAVCSLAGVVLAVTLYLTARGLDDHQAWARTMACVTSAAGTLVAAVACLTTRGLLRFVSLMIAALCGRVLWVLWQGYPI